MVALIFVSTFMAIGLSLLLVWQRFYRRRAADILRGHDPSQQWATVVRGPDIGQRWERAAKQAGLSWSGTTYFMISGAGLLLGLIFLIARQNVPAVIVAGAACVGPWAVVRIRQQARARQFIEQLPPALTLAANTIRAGGTMMQAVKGIARQMPDPIRTEFARVEQALQLQVPLGVALEQAGQRIGAPEFAAVVVACKIAGQAGGDLDTVLENISREIQEDRQFRDTMRAASSEGRNSAKIVTAIPILGAGFFLYTSPAYFDPMLSTSSTRMLLFGALAAIAVGWIVISRITDARNW